jgi:ATP-dependent RNA helicase DHX33
VNSLNPSSDERQILSVQAALFNLYSIEAMDQNRQLTTLGKQMARMPLEPSYARALLASKNYKCSSEVLDLVSLFSAGGNVFYDPSDHREKSLEARKKFDHPTGDHFLLLNVFKAYEALCAQESRKVCSEWCRAHFISEKTLLEARKIRDQLCDVCERLEIDISSRTSLDTDSILRCFAAGMPQNLARIFPEGGYRQLLGSGVSHRACLLNQ